MNLVTSWNSSLISLTAWLLILIGLSGCQRRVPPQPVPIVPPKPVVPPEPEYQGRSLSYWIKEMEKGWRRWDGASDLPKVLAEFGPEAVSAIPVLIDILSIYPQHCSPALTRIGASAVPALTEVLQDPEERRRYWAAATLGRIGIPAREAVPSLRALLRDEDGAVRVIAALALWQIAGTTEGAEVALDAPTLQAEIRVIRGIPDRSIECVMNPILLKGEPVVQLLAYHTLRRMGDIGIRVVEAATKSEDPARRERAAVLLEWLQPPPPSEKPLPSIMTYGNARHPVFLPVVKVEQPTPAHLKKLIIELQEKEYIDDYSTWAITGAIAGYGLEGVRQLVVVLKECLKEGSNSNPYNTSNTYQIVRALKWLGPRAVEAYPALLEALEHKSFAVKSQAIWAIHFIGKGREALPLLLTLLEVIDDDRLLAVADDKPFLLQVQGEGRWDEQRELQLTVIGFCAAEESDAKTALPLLIDRWEYGRGGYGVGSEQRKAIENALKKIASATPRRRRPVDLTSSVSVNDVKETKLITVPEIERLVKEEFGPTGLSSFDEVNRLRELLKQRSFRLDSRVEEWFEAIENNILNLNWSRKKEDSPE